MRLGKEIQVIDCVLSSSFLNLESYIYDLILYDIPSLGLMKFASLDIIYSKRLPLDPCA